MRRTNTGMILYNAGMQSKDAGRVEKKRDTLIGTFVLIGGFLTALLLSGVRIHGLHTPLSLGLLLGSQLAGMDPSGIVGGVVLGAFAAKQPNWQGMSIAILYWGITRLVLLFRKKCAPNARLLIFLICCLITLPISAVRGVEELLYSLVSISVSLLSAACFRRVCLTVRTMSRARIATDTEQGAFGLALGMLILSVSDVSYYGWSLAVSLILLGTAVCVSVRGVFGAAIGILWSVMLTLYVGCDAALIGCVALAALSAAAVREKGKLFTVGAFCFSGLLFQTYRIFEPNAMTAQNLAAGMLLYIVIPRKWIAALKDRLDPAYGSKRRIANAIRRTEQRASHEVERMGRLLGGFSGMFHAAPEEEDVACKWTVQGALAICQGCDRRTRCWRDADAMRDAILTLAEDAAQGIRVSPISPMDEYCRRFGDLCASVLLSSQQAANRNAVSRRARMQSGFIERQFSGAGAALCSFARRMRSRSRETDRREQLICDRLTEAGYAVESVDLFESDGVDTIAVCLHRPLKTKHSAVRWEIEQACGYRLRLIRAAQNERFVSFRFEQDAALHAAAEISRNTERGAVSGDATGECRFPGGHVCFALSDGMGRGKDARRESEAAIRLLFRLYRAGVERDLVYENVNRMLMAQNEAEMYATLDAISIDLNTGVAELLKYGAPPSFLVRDGSVSRLSGDALPCGILAEAKPSVIRLKLKKNDRIVLCSDGVQDALPDGVDAAIRQMHAPNVQTGEHLLKLARSYGGTDDMTVMVIRVA